MTRRPWTVAAVLACVLVLSACNEKTAAPQNIPSVPPPHPSGALPVPDTKTEVAGNIPVRLVPVPEGPGGTLQIKPPKQNRTKIGSDTPPPPPGEGYHTIAGFKLGEATEYLDMKAGSEVFLGDTRLMLISSAEPRHRQTIVIGTDVDGATYGTGFVEENGTVSFAYGRGNIHSMLPRPAKASLLVSAIGSGKSTQDQKLRLGVAGQGCLTQKAVSDQDFAVVEVEPGPVDLAWFADETCQEPAGGPRNVTITEGRQAYVFAWAEGKGEPKVLFLPIEK